jgi:hypothetical protein
MNASRPDPYPGFDGSVVLEDADFFTPSPRAGLRLLGSAPPEQYLLELERGEFLYACISDEGSPDTVLLRWVERGTQIGSDTPVVAYYGITDPALLDLSAPCLTG